MKNFPRMRGSPNRLWILPTDEMIKQIISFNLFNLLGVYKESIEN